MTYLHLPSRQDAPARQGAPGLRPGPCLAAAAAFGLLAMLASPAFAQSSTEVAASSSDVAAPARKPSFGDYIRPRGDPEPGYVVSIGFTSTLEPQHLGSKAYSPFGLPSISIRRSDELEDFSAPEDGLDYAILGNRSYQFGPVLSLRGDRNYDENRQLIGLKKYQGTADVGLFANFWPIEDRLRLRVEVRQGLRNRDGIIGDINVDYIERYGRFTFSGGPRLTFADAPANRLELGINYAEAARNGRLPAYDPGGGMRSVGVGTAVSYDWSAQWRTTVFARYDRLVEGSADSPIVRALGSPDQYTVGVSAVYSFKSNLSYESLGSLGGLF